MYHLTHDMSNTTDLITAHLAELSDSVRPIGSYFYWEKHCFDIPVCWAIRAVFDTFDNVDQLSEKLRFLTKALDVLIRLLPDMRAQMLPMLSTMKIMRDMMLVWHSTL